MGTMRAKEPEPADKKIFRGALAKDCHCYGEKHGGGYSDLPHGNGVGIRIKDGERRGPNHFFQVQRIGEQGIRKAKKGRGCRDGDHGTTGFLDEHGHDRAGCQEKEKWDFFQAQCREGCRFGRKLRNNARAERRWLAG